MKRSDSGDFCVLYIEPEDDKSAVFALLGEQNKPVVIILSPSGAQTRARVFQRPEDFSDLKHMRRQSNLTLFFVITGNEYLRQLATRNGFPTYSSIDTLGEALEEGRSSLTHQRVMAKNAQALAPGNSISPSPRLSPALASKPAFNISAKKTVPLAPAPIHTAARTHTPTPVPASRHTTDPVLSQFRRFP